MSTELPAVTAILARYASSARFSDLPSAVVHEATRAILHIIGVAIGGCRHPTVDHAIDALAPFAGPPGVQKHDPPLLFHLLNDPSEKFNVADAHPEVVKDLQQVIARHRQNAHNSPCPQIIVVHPLLGALRPRGGGEQNRERAAKHRTFIVSDSSGCRAGRGNVAR